MSASVPVSPSLLKSALLVRGAAGQFPAKHAKNASISASVPTSPSQLKSALPQCATGSAPPYGVPVCDDTVGLFTGDPFAVTLLMPPQLNVKLVKLAWPELVKL